MALGVLAILLPVASAAHLLEIEIAQMETHDDRVIVDLWISNGLRAPIEASLSWHIESGAEHVVHVNIPGQVAVPPEGVSIAAEVVLRPGTLGAPVHLEVRASARADNTTDVGATAIRFQTPHVPVRADDTENARVLLAAGSAAGLAFSLAYLFRSEHPRIKFWLLLAPLYTRLYRDALLDNANRDRIVRAVEKSPGVHYSQLLRITGLSPGVLLHHLRVLEQHKMVSSWRERSRRHYMMTGSLRQAGRPQVLSPQQERILKLIAEKAMTQTEIAAELGVTRQGANYHIKALEKQGKLVIAYDGQRWLCRPAVAHGTAPVA